MSGQAAPDKSDKKRSEKRNATVSLAVRYTPEEAALVRQKAKDVGVTVSEFHRAAALGRRTRSAMDSHIINELRKLGGLQKHLFTQSGGSNSKEHAEILKAIKEAIIQIGER
jgi:hypothetical protein